MNEETVELTDAEKARLARNLYLREYARKRYHTPEGKAAHEAAQTRKWIRKYEKYRAEGVL